MRNPRMIRRSAIGIAVAAIAATTLCYVAIAADYSADTKPVAVDAAQYADIFGNEVFDIQDLAEGAEIQRRFFNRITPPGLSWLQPMFPPVVPFDATNFDDSFLDYLLGEDKNSVSIYPLSLTLDPKTRETLVYNAEGKLIAAIPSDKITRTWPVDADPTRVTLLLDLLPTEDVEPYLYTESRVDESIAVAAAKSARSGGPAMRSLGTNEFGICNIQNLTNGNVRLTVTNGTDIAEVFTYTVLHTSSVVVVTWTNEESNVVTDTNTVWTPVSPPFNGIESEWAIATTNLSLTNGVGVWEDANISSNDRVRFYAVANRLDSDEDDLTGGTEIFLYYTDPDNPDSDGDDLFDGLEVNDHYTDPNNSDTDNDGLPDGWEVQNGLDPHDDGSTNSFNGAEGDLDGDGFNNALEYELDAPANNPAWNGAELAYRLTHAHTVTNTRSITTNMIGMRVEIEDSANCGGSNGTTQNVADVLAVPDLLAWGYFIDVTVAGAVEDQNEGYDIVTIEAHTNTYYFEGNENHNGCNMASKSTNRNVLILANSTVRLRYNTVRYMYHVGGYAEITAATESGYIKSETVSEYPTNRERTVVGVAEDVEISINPDPGGVTWSVSGGGSLNTTTGAVVLFTASSNASTCPVTINFSGDSLTKNFEVKEPSGVVDAFLGYWIQDIPVGEAGAKMKLHAIVGPTNVSFYKVQICEVGMDATNCTGYFQSNPPPSHNSGNGANQWIPLSFANQWEDYASIRGSYVAPPWQSGGSFEWPIPAQWRIGTSVNTNSMSGWNQLFELSADGTVKITKFGRWLQRETNNVITYN